MRERVLAERMLARLNGKHVPRVEEVRVELVERASTGGPT
jgi:DNA-binding LacI/PurR family transcriptional regulator